MVSLVDTIPLAELTSVSAALQKQISRDVAPIWGVQATVDVFPTLEAVPVGYWPLIVVEDAPGAGTHLDRSGQPVALVEAGATWSLAASHESIEMLIDPAGNELRAGDATDGSNARVEYLLEVCDPCQDVDCAYTVNGVLVSDFFTPSYLDPSGTTGARYSFSGRIKKPRDVLPGGYLTWRDPRDGHWYQVRNRGGARHVTDLGPIAPSASGFRQPLHAAGPPRVRLSRVPDDHPRVRDVRAHADLHRTSAATRASGWTHDLDAWRRR
jgi:hypothetical protein